MSEMWGISSPTNRVPKKEKTPFLTISQPKGNFNGLSPSAKPDNEVECRIYRG